MKNKIDRIIEKGSFHLIDHSITHNQFLYRSFVKSGLNRDILISGVRYISIPISIQDFQIYKGGKKEFETVRSKFNPNHEINIFVIEQNGVKHFVVADRILIQENEFKEFETSIPIKREKPLSEEDILNLANKTNLENKEKGVKFVIDNYIQTDEWKILE